MKDFFEFHLARAEFKYAPALGGSGLYDRGSDFGVCLGAHGIQDRSSALWAFAADFLDTRQVSEHSAYGLLRPVNLDHKLTGVVEFEHQVARGIQGQDLTLIHNHDPVTRCPDFGQDMGGEDDCPLAVHVPNQAPKFCGLLGVESDRRLI